MFIRYINKDEVEESEDEVPQGFRPLAARLSAGQLDNIMFLAPTYALAGF